jgi:carboxylate-amine ligase
VIPAHRFGSAPPWWLGVEEELYLVDAGTLEPAPDGFSRAFGAGSDRIKPELFESLVEIATGAVETADEAAGSHPTARGPVPVVPVERYLQMAKELGPRLSRQTVCGLHVHVSVPDADACLRAFEGVLPRLPGLLAASANSPFWEGEWSGWRSIRAQHLLELPTGGTPPLVRDWNDWRAASRGDAGRRHWDAWPRPEYGTLEIRVMDQPTSVRRSAELAAEVQRLVREAAESHVEPLDRAVYAAARERAALDGGGPEAERQLELGPAVALREAAGRTLE